MSKRIGSIYENSCKKARLSIDDLWGEDLDINDIDDCITLATQVCQTDNFHSVHKNNVSILPSYNAFKQNKDLFASTQANIRFELPSTSVIPQQYKYEVKTEISELKIKLQNLQKQYEAKEGESSILRSRLEEIKGTLEADYAKKRTEWTLKFNSTNKEIDAIKSELEFKNLEIANLKFKVMELSKGRSFETTMNIRDVEFCKEKDLIKTDVHLKNLTIHACIDRSYPLRNKISSRIFVLSNCKNVHIRNFPSKNIKKSINEHNVCDETVKLDINDIYQDMAKLMNSSTKEINSLKNYIHINKLICMFKLCLKSFNDVLKEDKLNITSECIRVKDMLFLERRSTTYEAQLSLFDSNEWCEDEVDIKLRQLIAFISELIPYSNYLCNHLVQEESLYLNNKAEISTYFPNCNIIDLENKIISIKVLPLLLNSVTIIGEIRKSNCVGFLCSTVLLLSKICPLQTIPSVNNFIYKIVKQILFTQMNKQVMYYVSIFLKEASLRDGFISTLCTMSSKNGLKKNSKEVFYFDNNTCVIQVLNVVYKDTILNEIQTDLQANTNMNMLKFINNVLSSNCLWLHYQENNHCDCLSKLTFLSIEIIYALVNFFIKLSGPNEPTGNTRATEFLSYLVSILHILTFRNFDLIEKYITTCSKYKSVIHTLLKNNSAGFTKEMNELMEQLTLEDAMETNQSYSFEAFNNIPLWNISCCYFNK